MLCRTRPQGGASALAAHRGHSSAAVAGSSRCHLGTCQLCPTWDPERAEGQGGRACQCGWYDGTRAFKGPRRPPSQASAGLKGCGLRPGGLCACACACAPVRAVNKDLPTSQEAQRPDHRSQLVLTEEGELVGGAQPSIARPRASPTGISWLRVSGMVVPPPMRGLGGAGGPEAAAEGPPSHPSQARVGRSLARSSP